MAASFKIVKGERDGGDAADALPPRLRATPMVGVLRCLAAVGRGGAADPIPVGTSPHIHAEGIPMKRTLPVVAALVAALVGLVGAGGLVGSRAQDGTPAASLATAPPVVQVALQDLNGQDAGVASFTEEGDGTVAVAVTVEGLVAGEHGIHVHAVGDCNTATADAFATAGEHFNPAGVAHGAPPFPAEDDGTPPAATPVTGEGHAGDLGNIVASETGSGRLRVVSDRFTLSAGETSLDDEDGSAILIHAQADDYRTDPGGDSGGRVVCGVIYPSTIPVATPEVATAPAAATPPA